MYDDERPWIQSSSNNDYFELNNSASSFDALDELSFYGLQMDLQNTWGSMIWKGTGAGWGFTGTFVWER